MILKNELKTGLKAIKNANKVEKNFVNSVILKNESKDIKTLVDLRINESIIRDLFVTNIPVISE